MPVTRDMLERALADLNRSARKGTEARVDAFAPEAFTLAFPERPLPEDQCMDNLFTDVQFMLHEREGVYTNLLEAAFDEDEDAYRVRYEVVEF